ncbi:MAG: hypothetical protein ABIW84_04185 [Ilumatobacteraceae bacterium]
MALYKTEINLAAGVPQTAFAVAMKPRGIALHWTAGGTGRAGALGTVKYFIDTRATVNASYHVLVFWEGGVLTAMWIVPSTRASHSMNPKPVSQGGPYAPNAEVRRILGPAVGDPNAASIAVSFCGMPADLAAALKSPVFVAAFRALVVDIAADHASMVERPLFNHGWAQPSSRYDAGNDLIPALYAATQEDFGMNNWQNNIKPSVCRATIAEGSAIRNAPYYKAAGVADATLRFYATRESSIQCVGIVEGDEFSGKTEWLVYVLGTGGLACVSAGNETRPRVEATGTVQIVEKIVNVPTGISQADVDTAIKVGIAEGIKREAARVRALLGL